MSTRHLRTLLLSLTLALLVQVGHAAWMPLSALIAPTHAHSHDVTALADDTHSPCCDSNADEQPMGSSHTHTGTQPNVQAHVHSCCLMPALTPQPAPMPGVAPRDRYPIAVDRHAPQDVVNAIFKPPKTQL